MRILVVTNMWPTPDHPHFGSFVRDQVTALRRLGLMVDVFFTDPKKSRAEYAMRLKALRRVFAERTYDVINAQHTYCVIQIRAATMGLKPKQTLVLTSHEGEILGPKTSPQPRLSPRHWVWLKRLAVRFVDRLIVVNPELAARLRYTGPCSVIPPGIDLQRFAPMDPKSAKDKLNMPNEQPFVFFPSDPSRPGKRHDLFLDAVARITQPVNVRAAGDIPPDQMPTYLNAADVVVLTSVYEASPMAIKEAMACNRPIVSTRVGDVAELFDGLDGHFLSTWDPVDIATCIERALERDGPTQGRKRLQQMDLTLPASAALTAEVFTSLVEEPSR